MSIKHIQSPVTSYPEEQSRLHDNIPLKDHLPHSLDTALSKAKELLISHQHAQGYWWYTLEANDSINAEYILLTHFLDQIDPVRQKQICNTIQFSQREDGSWPLYFEGPGDISTTIECYFALKLSGLDINSKCLTRARAFILTKGGLSKCRVFTRIHLAQFGIIPWSTCPAMPSWFILFPSNFLLNIYEFSSWARACIVPLLVILNQKKTKQLPHDFLNELLIEGSIEKFDWSFKTSKGFFSFENFLIQFDKFLKIIDQIPFSPLKNLSLKRCEKWIRNHIQSTEDIYPALAYGAMALSNLGYSSQDPCIQKCLNALRRFQIQLSNNEIPQLPSTSTLDSDKIYQQCCISPVWDTPWAGVALLEAGSNPGSEDLLKTGRWLLEKQITETYGDWSIKNKMALPGGWSFEFENEYFPDIDDTIEVLFFLSRISLPPSKMRQPIERALSWLVSMQSDNGGWAAFDKNNTKNIVNRIPFSDHGACLDPPTPDITGRMLELLPDFGYTLLSPITKKAIHFIEQTQESFGAWWGRWGVNYIYGTWCVLQGLRKIGYHMDSEKIHQAVNWLKLVQRPDGGFGESCQSYNENKFVPLNQSVPSQTAWGLMALIAAGQGLSGEAKNAADFLVKNQNADGSWDENHFTGTGFPGHFYIRYHGYRHYFPLLALAKYKNLFC